MADSVVAIKPPHPKTPNGSNQRITRLLPVHEAMIDQLVAEPRTTSKQLSEQFGFTLNWTHQIMLSNCFKERLRERSMESIDPMLLRTVNERVEAVLVVGLELLLVKLDNPPEKVSDNLVLRAIELSTRALGMGNTSHEPQGPLVNVNLHLEDLSDRLTGLLRRKKIAMEKEIAGETIEAKAEAG